MIARYIQTYTLHQGRPPTIREIAKANGIASTNGVECHLKALEGKGVIEREPTLARGIRMLCEV
jgi:repressor LexA